MTNRKEDGNDESRDINDNLSDRDAVAVIDFGHFDCGEEGNFFFLSMFLKCLRIWVC